MNEKILEELEKLSSYEKYNGNFFKHRAYEQAIKSIQQLNEEINSTYQLQDLKGVGKGITSKIQDILDETHQSPENHYFYEDLSSIYGIGPKTAKELINQGITDFHQLNVRQYEVLNEKQRIGLKYLNDLKERIPSKEMDLHYQLIQTYWPRNLTFEIVGSYRRNEPTSGDIDILVSYPKGQYEFKDLIKCLKKYLKETLALGDKKFMGIAKLGYLPHRRIDILYTPPEEYPYALLYFTGSDKYNRNLREYCLKRGLKLNEKGLINLKTLKIIPKLRSEREILTFLNLPYLEPFQRKDKLKKID